MVLFVPKNISNWFETRLATALNILLESALALPQTCIAALLCQDVWKALCINYWNHLMHTSVDLQFQFTMLVLLFLSWFRCLAIFWWIGTKSSMETYGPCETVVPNRHHGHLSFFFFCWKCRFWIIIQYLISWKLLHWKRLSRAAEDFLVSIVWSCNSC
jgi:hypothetical protein